MKSVLGKFPGECEDEDLEADGKDPLGNARYQVVRVELNALRYLVSNTAKPNVGLPVSLARTALPS